MSVDSIAYRITGMSQFEMFNYEHRQVYSSKDATLGPGCDDRYLDRFLFPDEMDKARAQLRKNIPSCLKTDLLSRIRSYLFR